MVKDSREGYDGAGSDGGTAAGGSEKKKKRV